MKIEDTEKIKCPRCGKNSSLLEWDAYTFEQCTSREMRRAFLHLNSSKAFEAKSDTFYICPTCKQWSRGSQLIIDSKDPMLSKLGRKPVVSYTKEL